MLPINQQNLAFLSISTDNTIENSNIGDDGGSLPSFDHLLSTYVIPLEDENVAAFDLSDLPLSNISNEQIPTENVTAAITSPAFFPADQQLVSDVASLKVENITIQNESHPSSVLLINATAESATFNSENLLHESSPNAYSIPVSTSPANTQQSNDIEIAIDKQPLQLNSAASANIDLVDTNVNPSTNLQQDSTVGQLDSESIVQPLNSTLNNSVPGLSASLSSIDIEQSSIEQINTVNISEDTPGSNQYVTRINDNDVQLFVNQENVVSSSTPNEEPTLISVPGNAHIATQNTKVTSLKNHENNQVKVTQSTTQIESDNFSNQSDAARSTLLNDQQNQVEANANTYFNKNNTNISSIDSAAAEKSYSPSPLVDNIDSVIEQKPITASSLAAQIDTNSQLAQNQTLLNINKATTLTSYSADLTNASDITNSNEIAKQLVLAQQNGTQQIRLLITPEHLGAVDISIQDAKEGVNIQIVTHNLTAKESLEAFMPRLREMLEQSGINIQDASVEHKQENSDSSFGSDYQQANKNNDENTDQHNDKNIQDQNHITTDIQLSDHILDAFA